MQWMDRHTATARLSKWRSKEDEKKAVGDGQEKDKKSVDEAFQLGMTCPLIYGDWHFGQRVPTAPCCAAATYPHPALAPSPHRCMAALARRPGGNLDGAGATRVDCAVLGGSGLHAKSLGASSAASKPRPAGLCSVQFLVVPSSGSCRPARKPAWACDRVSAIEVGWPYRGPHACTAALNLIPALAQLLLLLLLLPRLLRCTLPRPPSCGDNLSCDVWRRGQHGVVDGRPCGWWGLARRGGRSSPMSASSISCIKPTADVQATTAGSSQFRTIPKPRVNADKRSGIAPAVVMSAIRTAPSVHRCWADPPISSSGQDMGRMITINDVAGARNIRPERRTAGQRSQTRPKQGLSVSGRRSRKAA
ncbi:hypothetical protein BP6252_11450 [Coleophoma cylindrospora]|uniref:Uncharacterized protein n=1 Tax=Coleophoma cylindrospora TaxID=1849047 RepID=A0A3D8QJU2_9HELO|nr:hypothetical protein BP6252_11450 [Coleophoma cylindrospora]